MTLFKTLAKTHLLISYIAKKKCYFIFKMMFKVFAVRLINHLIFLFKIKTLLLSVLK